jgi:hypothetical protein
VPGSSVFAASKIPAAAGGGLSRICAQRQRNIQIMKLGAAEFPSRWGKKGLRNLEVELEYLLDINLKSVSRGISRKLRKNLGRRHKY